MCLRLLVTPDTIVRWHRDIVRHRWAAGSAHARTGRPSTRRNIQALVRRLARENPDVIAERWIVGCRRELLDRTLIWNQAHLRRILSDYETHTISLQHVKFVHEEPRLTCSGRASVPLLGFASG